MPNTLNFSAEGDATTKAILFYNPVLQTWVKGTLVDSVTKRYTATMAGIPAGFYTGLKCKLEGSSPEIIKIYTDGVTVRDGNTTPTPTPTALTVTFTIASETATSDGSLSYSAAVNGGTAPYQHLVQAENASTGAVKQIGSASTPNYAGIWQPLPAGTYDLTDTVTDAAGTVKISPVRRVVISPATTPTPTPTGNTAFLLFGNSKIWGQGANNWQPAIFPNQFTRVALGEVTRDILQPFGHAVYASGHGGKPWPALLEYVNDDVSTAFSGRTGYAKYVAVVCENTNSLAAGASVTQCVADADTTIAALRAKMQAVLPQGAVIEIWFMGDVPFGTQDISDKMLAVNDVFRQRALSGTGNVQKFLDSTSIPGQQTFADSLITGPNYVDKVHQPVPVQNMLARLIRKAAQGTDRVVVAGSDVVRIVTPAPVFLRFDEVNRCMIFDPQGATAAQLVYTVKGYQKDDRDINPTFVPVAAGMIINGEVRIPIGNGALNQYDFRILRTYLFDGIPPSLEAYGPPVDAATNTTPAPASEVLLDSELNGPSQADPTLGFLKGTNIDYSNGRASLLNAVSGIRDDSAIQQQRYLDNLGEYTLTYTGTATLYFTTASFGASTAWRTLQPGENITATFTAAASSERLIFYLAGAAGTYADKLSIVKTAQGAAGTEELDNATFNDPVPADSNGETNWNLGQGLKVAGNGYLEALEAYVETANTSNATRLWAYQILTAVPGAVYEISVKSSTGLGGGTLDFSDDTGSFYVADASIPNGNGTARVTAQKGQIFALFTIKATAPGQRIDEISFKRVS